VNYTRLLCLNFLFLSFVPVFVVSGCDMFVVTRTRVVHLKAPSLVLKPQHEGGENSVYRDATPAFLDSLHVEEREVYMIAMEMVNAARGRWVHHS
jgi:hypothetical protein